MADQMSGTTYQDLAGGVDEQRKMGLLLAATILAARKIATVSKNSPAYVCATNNAVLDAEKILARIDEKWLTEPK